MAVPEVESQGESPGRVLVVDDQDDVRRMLLRMLDVSHHQTLAASSARDALELAREYAFDLVVSDVQMPDMDGVDLLRALHELDPDLPVLLLSGAPDLNTAMKAVQYGAFEYFAKPLELERFLNSVGRAIAACRKRREDQADLQSFRSGERRSGMAAPEVHLDARFAGRYRVKQLIGRGGMGAVYEAVREDLAEMRVAIKVLHRNLEHDMEYLARFRREAETVAAINHPNIVRIVDFQAREGEHPFLVMELLQGASLAHVIETEGPLPQGRGAFVVSQVLDALAAAHHAKVIHRDLKPENVFLTSMSNLKDIVKLLDFGVAKVLDGAAALKLTRTGAVVGTPAYMAPELARGAVIDERSDLYSAGCVLYEALTGRPPYQAQNYHALLVAIQESEPPPLCMLQPRLDPAFAKFVMKAMAKDPNERFQSAREMNQALAPWVGVSSPAPISQRAG
jgi:CheY-like chemotaxis protein/tRNA A-37 threonylcarbamoyl transferase component Bud32